jgi:hypothetical protein
MPDTAKSLYRVTYHDAVGNITHRNVLATDSAAASAFIGAQQTLNVTQVATDVEIVGVDKPHLRISPKVATVVPPLGLTPAEMKDLKAIFAKVE